MKISASTNAKELAGWFRRFFKDQVPYVTSVAINKTALKFQEVQRGHQEDIFTVRRKSFVERAVKIKPFAKKGHLEAHVKIDPPGGQARAGILTKFEEDTSKSPFRGRSIAVPTADVPRTGAGIIRKGWRPKDLFSSATQHGRGRAIGTKGNVYKGRKNTLLIRKPGGRGVIFQQTSSGLTPLYFLVPVVRIKPELHFGANAQRVFDENYEVYFVRAFDEAARSAR